MAKRVTRSAKGETVDFDLLKIKAQIATAPKATNVKVREDYIDQRFKRRLKKLKRNVAEEVAEKQEPKVEDNSQMAGIQAILNNLTQIVGQLAQNANTGRPAPTPGSGDTGLAFQNANIL